MFDTYSYSNQALILKLVYNNHRSMTIVPSQATVLFRKWRVEFEIHRQVAWSGLPFEVMSN